MYPYKTPDHSFLILKLALSLSILIETLLVMKKLLSLFFILAGISFTHSAFAQTQDDSAKTKKTKKEAAKKASPSSGGNQGGGNITIDEGGTPKTKGKKTPPATMNNGGTPAADTTNSAPKQDQKGQQQSNQKTSGSPSPGAPDMAIDEGGTPKQKPKSSGSVVAPSTGLSNDSAAVAPTSGLERPH
jgi:hypothetical protein